MPKLKLEEKTKHINNLVSSKMEGMLDIIESAMTKQEMLDAIADIIDYVKDAEKNLGEKIDRKTQTALNDLESFKNAYERSLESLKEESTTKLSNIRQKALDRVSEFFVKSNIKGIIKEHERQINAKINEVDDKLREMYAYEFPDTESIAEEASKLVTVEKLNLEEELPKQGNRIRDGLELLQGEDRLRIEAIRDLREELDEIKKSMSKLGSGGGSIGRLYAEDQQFNGDDSTTVFTLSYVPVNNMLWVYRNGQQQNKTTHYTLSGNKVTMTSTLATGEELEVKYLR